MLNVIFEDISCLMVISLVGGVFAACFCILKNAKKAGWRAYSYKKWEVLTLCLGLIGVGCMAYGVLVEPFSLEITNTKVATRKLASRSHVRLVLISDLHCDGITRTEKRLPEVIAVAHPDVILFAGDAANNSNGVVAFRECMGALSRIAPVYAVYGNHDAHRNWKLYDGIDVTRLECNSRLIKVREVPLWIGGVGIDNERLLPATLQAAPKDAFSMFLYHYPVGIGPASAAKIDLVCAGHTHGGQVCLPFYGPVVTQSTLGRDFASGLHKVGDTWLYVTRGIGMTGLPARFLCPPEVSVIDVVAAP